MVEQPWRARLKGALDAAVEPIVYTPAELAQLVREGRDFIATILAEGTVVYERSDRQQRARSGPVAANR